MTYAIIIYTSLFLIACLEFLVKDEDRLELPPLPERNEYGVYEDN